MSKPITSVDLENIKNLGRWWARWFCMGGSSYHRARPMQDLRNEEDLRRYRLIEFKRRHSPYGDAAVVNLAAWRMRRARRQATS